MTALDPLLTIGAFARLVGLTPSALRFYDDCGLLPPDAVDASGYRRYSSGQARRAGLLRDARAAGMPLDQVRAVLEGPPDEAAALVRAHVQAVRDGVAPVRRAAERVLRRVVVGLPVMYRGPMYDGCMTEQMREPTYLLLTALAGGRQHGYGLMQDVATLSEGRVNLRAGTLYAALDRLVSEGLVVRDGEEVVSGRLRRYYLLSPAGAGVLREQTDQRQVAVRAAVVRLRALGVQA